MAEAHIRIWPELAGARINPNIYGHFAEYLGRCVYEGIWVGPRSRIPNQDGIRLDVLAALKQLRAPVIRWPGGCFADNYHWRDGIGPAENRPQTVNIWWQQVEPNTFGTDEFIALCRAIGCSPYICVNVGSGSVEEAREWVEYCNFGGDSALAQLRADNGNAQPYNVKYWGIGNENWGCGGNFAPDDYAREFIRYATYIHATDPGVETIACGCSPGDYSNEKHVRWNHDLCQAAAGSSLMDHLSIHRYFKRGHGAQFNDAEYNALFGDLLAMESDIQQADRLLAYFFPDRFVGLVIDEWGVWHPAAVVDNGLEQENTLRDAVFAGAALNLFNNYAHRVTMANIAQTINVLQCLAFTSKSDMVLTPTYYVYDMMRPHMGGRSIKNESDLPTFETHPVGFSKKRSVPALSISTSLSGKRIRLTVANQTVDQPVETAIEVREADIASVSGRVLATDSPRDMNTFEDPKVVTPKRLKADYEKGELVHTFPPHSFTALTITLG